MRKAESPGSRRDSRHASTVYFREDVHNSLRLGAALMGRSVSGMIEYLAESWIERNREALDRAKALQKVRLL